MVPLALCLTPTRSEYPFRGNLQYGSSKLTLLTVTAALATMYSGVQPVGFPRQLPGCC